MDSRGLVPAERPAAVFDALADRFARDDFRGCAFINTMIESADRDSAAHRVAAEHKRTAVREGRPDVARRAGRIARTLLVAGN